MKKRMITSGGTHPITDKYTRTNYRVKSLSEQPS